MIDVLGEILLDLLGEEQGSHLSLTASLGGAPFNVAATIALEGGSACFYGRVGHDGFGEYIQKKALQIPFQNCFLKVDDGRNTTLAFVSLDEKKERHFSFYRKNTADPFFNEDSFSFASFKNASIVHLGSLMLSFKEGRGFAKQVIEECQLQKKLLSFDVNYREDIYSSQNEAVSSSLLVMKSADILKVSDDEISLFVASGKVDDFLKGCCKKGAIVVITRGKEGSECYAFDRHYVAGSEKVKVVDTTGAGDAFYACFLRQIDEQITQGLSLRDCDWHAFLKEANHAGALCTTHVGALLLP